MKITPEQYNKIIEADSKPIDIKSIKEFKEIIKNFDDSKIKTIEVNNEI